MIKVGGGTYRLRKLLKELGGKWDAAGRCWLLPDQAEGVVSRVAQEYGCQVSVNFVPGESRGDGAL